MGSHFYPVKRLGFLNHRALCRATPCAAPLSGHRERLSRAGAPRPEVLGSASKRASARQSTQGGSGGPGCASRLAGLHGHLLWGAWVCGAAQVLTGPPWALSCNATQHGSPNQRKGLGDSVTGQCDSHCEDQKLQCWIQGKAHCPNPSLVIIIITIIIIKTCCTE